MNLEANSVDIRQRCLSFKYKLITGGYKDFPKLQFERRK